MKYLQAVRPALLTGPDTKALFLNELGEALGLDWLSILVRRYVNRAQVG